MSPLRVPIEILNTKSKSSYYPLLIDYSAEIVPALYMLFKIEASYSQFEFLMRTRAPVLFSID